MTADRCDHDVGRSRWNRNTVDVTIPVDTDVAAALTDPRNRETVGRRLGRVLRPRAGRSPLARAIAEMRADARGRIDGRR